MYKPFFRPVYNCAVELPAHPEFIPAERPKNDTVFFYSSLAFNGILFSHLSGQPKTFFMQEMNNQKQNGQRKSVRGFAAMDAEKQKEIGVAHEWSSQEAREAGKKGGQARGRQTQDEGPII